jgi:hypothetical protein
MKLAPNRIARLVRTFSLTALAVVALTGLSGCKMSVEDRASYATKYLSRKLELNEAQKAEVEVLAKQAVEDFKGMKPDRKELADEVEKQMVADKADVTQIKKLMASQQAKRQMLTDKWITKIAEFHAKLNPEQKQEAAKLLKKYSKKFRGQFGDEDDSSNRE